VVVFGEGEEGGLLDIGGREGEVVVETEDEFAVATDAYHIADHTTERTVDADEFLAILSVIFERVWNDCEMR